MRWEVPKVSFLKKQVESISEGMTEFYIPGTIMNGILLLLDVIYTRYTWM